MSGPAPAGEADSARPRKRSLSLHGHRTSVSLEDAFWDALRAAAAEEGLSVAALVERIDDARQGAGLASAIRVWLLRRALLAAGPPALTGS